MADLDLSLKDSLLDGLGSSAPQALPSLGEAASARPSVPDHVLLRVIGKGSYGEVWLARNIMGAARAVKVVRRAAFDSDRPYDREFAGIRRFEPISRAHPSQLNVLHVGRDMAAGYFYYVMELADPVDAPAGASQEWRDHCEAVPARYGSGVAAACVAMTYAPRTLRSELQRHGRLRVKECLEIGLALATALDHLHQHGLVHRDIKPSNIVFVNGIPKLADIGLVTHVEESLSFVGTQGYLPPEGPGTPQADIFGLGKVLYEMATGRDRQEYPELPTDLIAAPEAERTALAELNEVIVKACHAEPRWRYQTAAELHADLALLHSGESVFRIRAIERRLRVVQRVGAVFAGSAVLAAGLYIWQSHQTRAMRELAATQILLAKENGRLASENREVAAFLKTMLGSVKPSVALGRDTALLRDVLDEAAARVETELKDKIRAELLTTIGVAYRDIKEFDRSESALRQALAIRRRLSNGQGLEAEALLELSETLFMKQDRHAEAEQALRDALVCYSQGPARLRSSAGPSLPRALHHLAERLVQRNAWLEARPLAEQAMALYRDHPEWPPAERTHAVDVLATIRGRLEGPNAAVGFYEEEIADHRSVDSSPTVHLAGLLHQLGMLHLRNGRLDQALSALREALQVVRAWAESDPDSHDHIAGLVLHHLADVTRRANQDLTEARTLAQEAVALYERHSTWPLFERRHALGVLRDILMDLKDFSGAAVTCQVSLQLARDQTSSDTELADVLEALALALVAGEQFAEAEPVARECLELRERTVPDDWRTFEIRSLLGDSLLGQKRFEEAAPLIIAGFQGMKEREAVIPGEGRAPLKEALARLISLCEETQRPQEAASWKERLANLDACP